MDTMISSIASSTIIYPIDITKAHYQVLRYSDNKTNTIKDVIKNIYKKNGGKGFFRGNMLNISTYPVFWTVYFSVYDSIYCKFSPDGGYISKFCVAWLSGAVGSTVASPFYVIKTRAQTEILNSDKKCAYTERSKNMYKKEGFKVFYKGNMATLLSNFKLGIQMPLCDKFIELTGNAFIGAGLGKIICSSIFYPFDLIRTNLRYSKQKRTIFDMCKHIFFKDGIRGFYRGISLYTCMTAPNFVLMMGFRDILKKYDI